jgi:hypothetical protein
MAGYMPVSIGAIYDLGYTKGTNTEITVTVLFLQSAS